MANSCHVRMRDGNRCKRKIQDKIRATCVFHTSNDKEKGTFSKELITYLWQVLKDPNISEYDFTRFIFPDVYLLPKKFSKTAYFWESEFKCEASFAKTVFEKEAMFVEAKFHNKCDFSLAEFKNVANFSSASFFQSATFKQTKFKNLCSLFGAHISGKIFFEETEFSHLDFRKIALERDAEAQFFAVDLSKALFLHTDLGRIDFINVNWEKEKKTLFGGREKLYDEKLTVDANARGTFNSIAAEKYKCDKPGLEHLYRQLKKKYDEKAHYRAAGDFHKGEMEIIRLRTSESKLFSFDRLDYCASFIYKLLSYYGENYGFALFWIFVLWFIFTNLFMVAGLQSVEGMANLKVDYNFALTIPLFQSDYWTDFFEALKHTFTIFYFARFQYFTVIDQCIGPYLNIFGYISSVVIHALFLLAIRRRFKR